MKFGVTPAGGAKAGKWVRGSMFTEEGRASPFPSRRKTLESRSNPEWNLAAYVSTSLSRSLQELGCPLTDLPLGLLEARLQVLHVRGSDESVFIELVISRALLRGVCTNGHGCGSTQY